MRRVSTDIFKPGSEKSKEIVTKLYSGVDRAKLRQCEETAVEKFAANVENQITNFHAENEDKAPLDKLKRIARDLNSFSPRARESLARKNETGKYIKLAKDGIGTIERDVAKHQKNE